MYDDNPLPSFHTSQIPFLPQIYSPFVSLQNKAELQETMTKHGKRIYTRQDESPHILQWTRQPNRSKGPKSRQNNQTQPLPFLEVSQKYLGHGRVPGVIHAAPPDLSPHTHLVVAASVCVNTQEQLGSGRVGCEGRKCRIKGNRGRRQCASLVWQKLPEICESNSSENS